MTADGVEGVDVVAIEPMRWWDIEEVLSLERRLFPSDPWSAGQFWGELAHVPATRAYVVLRAGGRIFGYGGIFIVTPDADIQTIAVAPEVAGRGLGTRLLGDLEDRAILQGASRMTLEVRADNVEAKGLYAKAGYEQIAVRKRYYGDVDALIMSKRLVPGRGTAGAVQ